MKPEDRSRLEARLADMLGVLGADGCAAFLSLTRVNLRELVERPAPWTTADIQAGVDIAMLLGQQEAEDACRAVQAAPGAPDGAARARLQEVVAYLETRP
ncbi:hypothetical protein AS593_00540 [Caulobacter vibrioides]|nr:hypothetical protein AS593_00540 [Caulobacter vibrioides]